MPWAQASRGGGLEEGLQSAVAGVDGIPDESSWSWVT